MSAYWSPSTWAEPVDITGRLDRDVRSFLHHYRRDHTYLHSKDVEEEARSLAQRFGLDAEFASVAALLHDVSAVIPAAERAHVAKTWGLDVLPEEEAFPLVIHQKLSAVFATEVFGVRNETILGAIECHTTLRANPSELDLLLFVADKIRWDQLGTPPYLAALVTALERSLEDAAFSYLEHMWNRRSQLAVVHPWLAEAHTDLSRNRTG